MFSFFTLIEKCLLVDRLTGILRFRTGLEPATPCVTGMYSNQLNYRTFSHQVTVVTLNCGAKIDSFSYYTIFRF